MAKTITSWQPGTSGNPGGRPAKHRALTEMLRMKSEDQVSVGGELMSGKEALAQAVWQFVITGEVWLQGKKLEADSINEWLSAVKWLYTYIEPPKSGDAEVEQEMTVRIERVQKPYLNPEALKAFAKRNHPHPLPPPRCARRGRNILGHRWDGARFIVSNRKRQWSTRIHRRIILGWIGGRIGIIRVCR